MTGTSTDTSSSGGSTMSPSPVSTPASPSPAWLLLFSAWFIALIATLGALFIGEVLGQAPCELCWYQRIAMFPLALILGIACLSYDFSIYRYALPLAIAGGIVALWHTLLYAGVISEAIVPCSADGPSCTGSSMTIMNVIPLPIISLVSFAAISILLFILPGKYTDE